MVSLPDPSQPAIELDLESGYRLWSEVYDSEYNPLIAVEKRVVDPLLESIAFRDVLDAGAGTGRWSLRLAGRGAHVTAFDQSAEMLKVAETKATATGLSIDFQQGRLGERLPFPDASFDLVVSALVFSHLPDLRPVVDELSRVLQPGGRLLVTDFHPDIIAAGGRAEFRKDGARYFLPNPGLSRQDYLDAVSVAGLRLDHVVDVPVAALTDVVKQFFLETFGEHDFCLVLLAQK